MRKWHITAAGDQEAAVKYGLTVLAKCGEVFAPRYIGGSTKRPEIPDCAECHLPSPTRVADVAHFVYRCYDQAGQLIYVGCSVAPRQRLDQHRLSSWWSGQVARVRYTVFPNREYALYKEREAIEQENPRWNIKGRDLDAFDLADFRDLFFALSTTGASAKRLEAIRAKALLRFNVDLTDVAADEVAS